MASENDDLRESTHRLAAALILASTAASTAVAGVIEFVDEDREEWFDAVLEVTTIDFTGFPDHTFITNQYENLGVLFLDGDDNIACCAESLFPQDGAGLDGNAAIHLLFSSSQRWIAADFPGVLQFQLGFEGNLIYQSSEFGGTGVGHFAGLLSTVPFDEAILIDSCDLIQVNLDNLYFGFLPLGDLDGDGVVGITDFLALLGAWGFCPPPIGCLTDLDCDGTVGITDLLTLLANWG